MTIKLPLGIDVCVLSPRSASALSIHWRGFNLHLLVEREYRVWGYKEGWHDGPLHDYGLGPVALFCYMYSVPSAMDEVYDRTSSRDDD
jgi:hypothetical protein